MKRNVFLIVVALMAVFVGLYWRERSREAALLLPKGEVSQSEETALSEAEVSPSPVPSSQEAAQVPSPGSAPLRESLPDLQEYRANVRENPHGVPRVLQIFSTALGAKMERALRTEQAARNLMPELEECVTQGEVSAARQACLVNARRLSRKYPTLQGEAEKVEKAAPAPLRARVDQLGLD